jgi:hypothetical protein
MTDTELEEVIQKATKIGFQNGVYSLFFSTEEVPGYVSLTFNDEHIYDAINLCKFLKNDVASYKKNILIHQSEPGKFDLTLIIERETPIVLTVKNLVGSDERFKWFLKKEPHDKPIGLLFFHNMRPTTLEKTAELMTATGDADFHQSIQIDTWKGFFPAESGKADSA